jgi:hypothetical protein
MAEVHAWQTETDDGEFIDLAVTEPTGGTPKVIMEVQRTLDTPVRRALSPKRARELARDLNAAARVASQK